MADKFLANPRMWLLDSGANASSCHAHSAFIDIQPKDGLITSMAGENIAVKGVGTVAIGSDIAIDNVLHVPESATNLLSVSKLAKN
ncbi:hypothetical protein LPJ72_006275, partial [Coemansia sp. Benny D160-2]